jgi:hypothetical protein
MMRKPGRRDLSPSPNSRCTGPLTTTKQGKRTMHMIHERAFALLLAVAISGAAFNTFII